MATQPAVALTLLIMHISAVLLLLALGSVTGQDCNDKYDILPDLDRRSRNYAVSRPSEPYVNDRYLPPKWYNVLSNNMPTDSANIESGSSCGSYYPGWMNGTVPDKGNVVSRKVCFVTFSGICGQERTIQVKNCSTFMLYNLVSTAASMAYCFDSLKDFKVPVHAPEFQPDFIAVQHDLIFTPEMEPSNSKEYYKPRLKFQCNFTKSHEVEWYYTVYWYINEKYLLKKGPILYPNLNNTDLLESDLISGGYKLDITIKCGVSASVTEESYLSKKTFSPGFWMGIRVLNSTVFLKEGKTADIQFQSTVPFGCNSKKSDGPKCVLSIQMIDPSDTHDCEKSSLSSSDLCASELPGVIYSQWDEGIRYYNTSTMTITTRDSESYDSSSRTFRLSLIATATDVNDIMNYTQLKDITVEVVGEKVYQGKKCEANVDPHMLSFDGRKYDNQNLGEFIMYNNTKFKQQVQIKTTPCWTAAATCACAVSVRAGGDLFVLNRCDNKAFIDFVSCKENIIDVRRPKETPNIYEIHLPLGTIVTVFLSPWPTYGSTMNVLITPAIKDVNATEGLCGLLNDHEGDDWKKRNGNEAKNENEFSLSWSINSSESFLNAKYEPDMWEKAARFCFCPNSTGHIQDGTNDDQPVNPVCSSSMFKTCKRKIDPNTEKYGNCNIRTKRSKASKKREIQRIFKETTPEAGYRQRINDSTNFHHIGKRSTFEDSYAMCSEIFRVNCSTAAFENELPPVTQNSKNVSLVNCALDYQITGDRSLANIHCESYRIESEMEIRKNKTFREVHADLVKSFKSATCINNCYGHGDCVNGTCICHDSYIEKDCSVSLHDYPAVDDTYAGGLCKKDMDLCCGELPIYGSRFVQGRTRQKVEGFQIDVNDTFQVVETIETNITVYNPFQAEMIVPCPLRKRRSTDVDNAIFVRGTRVSLTNDGTNYGSMQYFYIYDPNCQGVSKNATKYNFYILDGKCFINNECYSENQRNPSDSCEMCQPLVNPYFWTRAHNATTAPSVLQRSDVECQTTSFKIFIPKHLVPGNGTVTWRDSACVVHSNGTHFVDSVGLRDCGTTLTLEADSVVFENELILHKNGTQMQKGNNIITYGSDYEFAIPVKCVYPRNSNISTSYIPIVQQVKILERRNGQLDLTMRQYEAEDYSHPVPFNAYPRQVPLNNDIFIRLAMENNVTGLGLSADNCFATSTPSPVDPNWYQLISSGCPVNNAKIHPSGINDVKFSFHAFNFRHNTSGIVYVHCQVSVCLDTDPACVVGCVTRKKRSASTREGAITSNLISTGPFILTADEGGVATSTVVAAVSIAVAVIATVVAIIGWTRKSKKGGDC